MAKPNYAFAKRQRELAKKQKLEEKRLRKAAGTPEPAEDGSAPDADAAAQDPAPAPGPAPSDSRP